MIESSNNIENPETSHILGELNETVGRLRLENACLKLGVREDCVEDVTLLSMRYAGDGDELGAIGRVIEKYPHFAAQTKSQVQARPVFGVRTGNASERNDRLYSIAEKMGISL